MQSIYFQGFTLFIQIITTPLSVESPHIGPHAQSKETIPKSKQKRGIKNPVTKKPKTTPIVLIFLPHWRGQPNNIHIIHI